MDKPRDSAPAEALALDRDGKVVRLVIDHEASGLTPPDASLLLSLHPFNSSPSMIDVAPSSWGEMAGHVFVAEWGDLAPPTNPLRGQEPAGSRVVQVDPESGEITPFVSNTQPGPASMNDAQGQGLDQPFEVAFGPDGALYIVDYGVVKTIRPCRKSRTSRRIARWPGPASSAR